MSYYNHDDLGNYSHTYVNGLLARIAELESASTPAVSAEPTSGFDPQLAINLAVIAHQHVSNGGMRHDVGMALATAAKQFYATPTVTGQDATVRDAALESAARAVEEQHGFYGESPAKTIRAMKAKP